MSAKFAHLHTHSHYSLLQATPKVAELVAEVKKQGMPSVALTDNGNLYGAIEFYKECKKNGIKPIIGVDFYVAPRTRHDKQSGTDNHTSKLLLLAKNKNGYQNLIKLVTASFLEGFYYRPRIDRELLEKHHEDLLVIAPSFGGVMARNVLENKDKVLEYASWLEELFGKDNFYIEITRHPEIEGHDKKMEELVRIAKEMNFKLVAAHNIFYLRDAEKKARNTMISIQSQSEARGRMAGAEDFSFKSASEMEKTFKDLPEALASTLEISNKCNLELELGSWVFPDYEIPPGSTYDGELKKIVESGITRRGLTEDVKLRERIDYELEVIRTKGYAPYFLVVGDLLRYAKENGILTTIRGSVAGSLVTYLAGITNVNPLEYKLPFERFLNPERPSAPDIDMDYADNRRDEIIEYAKHKYGENKVAQIGTFGTMLARGAVRDVARALGYSYNDGDRIAKMIPFGSQGFPMTIAKALELEPDLKKIYKEEEEAQEIINIAKQIEGCARHISIHAAGVVISPTPLIDFVPLQLDPKGGKIITQFDMHSVEDAGLLKFDFLGLKNLAILADSVSLVERLYGQKIDIEKIPLDNEQTFAMLARGETMGVFQLSGQAMTHYLKELKPSSIHDINAMVALYRPGPMEMIPEYVERKHNSEKVSFLDPRMKDILDQSYGVITYQDDVMLIAINLAGYSWLEADMLRKAMGKKIPEVMAKQKEKLIKGLLEHGMDKMKAEKLWSLIEPFAAYGFNKAHAASYGRVAYQTAYMKANFPAAYMASVLTADAGDVEKVAEIITECKRMNVEVLPPDINESFGNFTVVNESGEHKPDIKNEKIRFGLYSIKNFGKGIADSIIKVRKEGGRFETLVSFLDRVQDRNLNKKSLEALIKCGAMDALGERGQMLGNLDSLLEYAREKHKNGGSQDSLFGLMNVGELSAITLEVHPPAPVKDKLLWEKELLGLYVSGHPLDEYKEKFEKSDTDILKIRKEGINGGTVILAGIVDECKTILTKKGEKMAFVKLSDLSGSIETVAFPAVYKKYTELLVPEACVALKGKFSKKNGEPSMLIDAVKKLD